MLKAIAWLNVMQSGKIRPNPRNVFCRIRTTRPARRIIREAAADALFFSGKNLQACFSPAQQNCCAVACRLTHQGVNLLFEFYFGFAEQLGGRCLMARLVRCGLIQTHCEWSPEKYAIKDISKKMLEKTEKLIEAAAKKKTQILCLQELFNGPYFCAEQQIRWHELTEPIPDGPTTERMKKLAKKHGMVMVVPIYEREMTGFFFNTAAVIDADGKYLGKYRKHHIPQVAPGFWEKFYFTPGNTGYVVFDTKFARVGVYICYDRHFPEGARVLGLNGAEIVFNPSATVAGLSEYLWELEQPAHAAANGYFVGAINRVGKEAPWNIGEFYGKSYFCNPRGKITAQASRDKDELLTHDIDLDEIAQVRATWQFFRDRRPESYGEISRTQAQARADAAN
jgi:N-carbamoylputrescine amidase